MSKKFYLRLLEFKIAAFVIGICIGSFTVYAATVDEHFEVADSTRTYASERFGYELTYPKGWKVYEIPDMSYVRFENIDAHTLDSLSKAKQSEYFKIEVVVLPAHNLPLDEWVDRQNTTSYPIPKVLEQETIDVAGYKGMYQMEQFGSMVHPVVFVLKDDRIYLFNISPNYKSYELEIEAFLRDFKFNS